MTSWRGINQNEYNVQKDSYAHVVQQGLVTPYAAMICATGLHTGSTGPIIITTGFGVPPRVGQEIRFGGLTSTGNNINSTGYAWSGRITTITVGTGSSGSGTFYISPGVTNTVATGSLVFRRELSNAFPRPVSKGGLA